MHPSQPPRGSKTIKKLLKGLCGAQPKEMVVTTGKPLRVAVPVLDKSTRDKKHGSGDPLGERKQPF